MRNNYVSTSPSLAGVAANYYSLSEVIPGVKTS